MYAPYQDTDEAYDSHQCFIAGIRCHVDEARFGGIVIEKTTDATFRLVGTFSIDNRLREAWRAGKLHGPWLARYPELFDDDDYRLAEPRYAEGKHFCEWWSAILLHHMTGYHSLVAKYEFGKHKRKTEIGKKLLSPKILAMCRDRVEHGSAQAPDLLMFAPDLTDWFFCEVKGPNDRLRPAQRTKFAALAAASNRPVRLVKLRWSSV